MTPPIHSVRFIPYVSGKHFSADEVAFSCRASKQETTIGRMTDNGSDDVAEAKRMVKMFRDDIARLRSHEEPALDDEVVIDSDVDDIYVSGQTKQCSLKSKTVSRNHARITWKKQDGTGHLYPYLKDEGSTHGTFLSHVDDIHLVDPQKVDPSIPEALHENDIIIFGKVVHKEDRVEYLPSAFKVQILSAPGEHGNSSGSGSGRSASSEFEEQPIMTPLAEDDVSAIPQTLYVDLSSDVDDDGESEEANDTGDVKVGINVTLSRKCFEDGFNEGKDEIAPESYAGSDDINCLIDDELNQSWERNDLAHSHKDSHIKSVLVEQEKSDPSQADSNEIARIEEVNMIDFDRALSGMSSSPSLSDGSSSQEDEEMLPLSPPKSNFDQLGGPRVPRASTEELAERRRAADLSHSEDRLSAVLQDLAAVQERSEGLATTTSLDDCSVPNKKSVLLRWSPTGIRETLRRSWVRPTVKQPLVQTSAHLSASSLPDAQKTATVNVASEENIGMPQAGRSSREASPVLSNSSPLPSKGKKRAIDDLYAESNSTPEIINSSLPSPPEKDDKAVPTPPETKRLRTSSFGLGLAAGVVAGVVGTIVGLGSMALNETDLIL